MKDLFKKEREAWIENARVTARKLLDNKSLITIEDVLKECPRPPYLHRNTTGSVFRCDDFVAVGWRKSERPLMNARIDGKSKTNSKS